MTERRGKGTAGGSEDFAEALEQTVIEAVLDGISVEGAWDVSRNDLPRLPDFTVEIYKVNRDGGD